MYRSTVIVALPVLLIGLHTIFASLTQAAEKRYALLIGNQFYDASVGVLKNPHNDVALVAQALQGQGFEILPIVRDAKRTDILGAVRSLTAKLKAAGPEAVGFLYYSGHGAAEKDTNLNYLIPTDAREPGTSAFWDASLKLDDIMRLLDGARAAVKFVVFDACRNELQLPTRDTSKGLLPVAEQQGYFVAYASAPGRTASDRGELSGPYAAALAKELTKEGLDHLNLFQNVKEAVIASTGGAQYPWESNGLSRRIYLTGEPNTQADMAMWETVRTTNDVARLQAYLESYPKGLFAGTAEQMKRQIMEEAAQREAERLAEAERRTLEALRLEELRKAVEEAEYARKAMAEAEAKRLAAERVADAARATAAAQEKASGDATDPKSEPAAAVDQRAEIATAAAQATRDALAIAEARFRAAEQRLSVLERAKTSNSSQQSKDDRSKVASVAPLEMPASSGKFDGVWTITHTSKNCRNRAGNWRMSIAGARVTVFRRSTELTGEVRNDGHFSYFMPAASDGAPMRVSGVLTGETGTGVYERTDGRCNGVMTLKRE